MEKREVIVPERGSELYQGLLKIFKGKRDLFSSIGLSPFEVIKDEELLDWGLSDAAGYLPDYIKMGESYLDDTNAHPPIGLGEYFLMWVLLKMTLIFLQLAIQLTKKSLRNGTMDTHLKK